MRYTRYDYKNKKGGNVVFSLIIIGILAIALGIGIFKLFFYNDGSGLNNISNVPNESNSPLNQKNFIALQCGVFSNKENADIALGKLPSSYVGFIVEDKDKYKVIAGIYNEEDAEAKSEELAKESIDNYKAKYTINIKNSNDKIECEIINGLLDIANTLSQSEVKSVKTLEFKNWLSNIENNEEITGEEVFALIQNLNNLPEEVTISSINEHIVYVYNILYKNKIS